MYQATFDQSIQFLTNALLNPRAKNICAVSIGLCALSVEERLNKCRTTASKIRLINAYPDLPRSGMAFLTSNSNCTEEDFNAFRDQLLQCNCDMEEVGIFHSGVDWAGWCRKVVTKEKTMITLDPHVEIQELTVMTRSAKPELASSSLLLHVAVQIVGHCIQLSLAKLTKHKFRSGTVDRGSGGLSASSKWPQDHDDLFPGGMHQAIHGLIDWLKDVDALLAQHQSGESIPVDYSLFSLAGNLVAFYDPFAEDLLNPARMQLLVEIPKQHLKIALQFYQSNQLAPFSRILHGVVHFFGLVENYDRIRYDGFMYRGGPDWYGPLERLNNILSTMPQWKRLHNWFCRSAQLAHWGMRRCPLHSGIPMQLEQPDLRRTVCDDLEDVFNTMKVTRKAGCYNPTCTSSDGAIRAQLCSRCDVVRYCGKECQRGAWKVEKYPHKDVCTKIQALRRAIGDTEWGAMWGIAYPFTAFHDYFHKHRLDAELIKTISSDLMGVAGERDRLRNQKLVAVGDVSGGEGALTLAA